MRTASGIAVVAVMSKPHRCPHIATTHAVCVYCPGGPDSDFEYSTQSYTGECLLSALCLMFFARISKGCWQCLAWSEEHAGLLTWLLSGRPAAASVGSDHGWFECHTVFTL